MDTVKDVARKMIFWDILQGMALTFKYMWTKPITLRYPKERWVPADRFRGQVALVRDEKTMDADLCVGCCLCVRVCPSKAIHMETSMGENNRKCIDEYDIDVARCIYCGNCVEICPVNALVSTDLYEVAVEDRNELKRDKSTLLDQGHSWRDRKKREKTAGLSSQRIVK